MLAQALVEFEGGQAALLFDAATRFGPADRSIVTGSRGTVSSNGPDLGNQQVRLTTAQGVARPKLQGTWFREGFLGTMGALLTAVEDRYAARHRVRPGITGWAQVNGYRGELDTIEKLRGRVEYDINYIENWSLMLDIKIILMTALKVVYDPKAY